MKLVHRLLHGRCGAAEVCAFETPSDRDVTLQVFAANFCLRRQFGYSRQCSQRSGTPTAAGKQSAAHGFQCCSITSWKAHANRVGSVIVNYWIGRGLASENSGGIGGYFVGSETSASGY